MLYKGLFEMLLKGLYIKGLGKVLFDVLFKGLISEVIEGIT